MDLPDQGAPLGPVLTAITLTRESLTSTNEARDIAPEVEIGMVNPGKNYLLDSPTLAVYPCMAFVVGLPVPKLCYCGLSFCNGEAAFIWCCLGCIIRMTVNNTDEIPWTRW